MTNTPSNHLRLHVAEEIRDEARTAEGVDAIFGELRGPFADATGWSLELLTGLPASDRLDAAVEIPAGEIGVSAHLRIVPRPTKAGIIADQPTAQRLASAVARLAGKLLVAEDALWKREAELAAGVPVTLQSDAGAHLAVRLQSVLRGAAESAGCQAAGLYLLDSDTSVLKLRSCWGLPHDRLAAPARPLRGAIADLEALLGHAVVLDNLANFPHWNAPESFASAVCVPVSTPTVPLGTLWVFCDKARDFSAHETGVLEMAAGRLAADLEREMLLAEGLDGHRLKRQLAGAERLQHGQLPRVAPLVDGWEVAGCCDQRDPLGGDFYDWFPVSRGPRWGLAIGDALHAGVEGALVAANVRSALRAHARSINDPGRLLTAVNRTIWTSSAGDQSASLRTIVVEPNSGLVRVSAAGTLGMLALRRDGSWHSLARPTLCLGREPTQRYQTLQLEIDAGDVLVAYTDGYGEARGPDGIALAESTLADTLQPYLAAGVDQICDAVRATFDRHAPSHDDRTALVIRRRPAR